MRRRTLGSLRWLALRPLRRLLRSLGLGELGDELGHLFELGDRGRVDLAGLESLGERLVRSSEGLGKPGSFGGLTTASGTSLEGG